LDLCLTDEALLSQKRFFHNVGFRYLNMKSNID
jgi:hypothetical protein